MLVEKYKSLAFTLALRITKNEEDAEEIAQDAFLKVYQGLSGFRNESKFTTWLYKIVFTTAMSRMRKKRPETNPIDDKIGEDGNDNRVPDNLELMHQEERKKMVASAVSQLKEDEATAITLYYLAENTVHEISEITGFSESNIKVLLFRGRKNLLEILKKILKQEIADVL